MQKEPRRKRFLRQGRQAILQKPCQDGNLKFGIQKQTKPNPKPYLYIEMWAFFSLSKYLIFFWKTSKIFPDWSRFFLIDPEEKWWKQVCEETKKMCDFLFTYIIIYYTVQFSKKKRNLLTNKNIKTFVCWKLLHKYVYSSDF